MERVRYHPKPPALVLLVVADRAAPDVLGAVATAESWRFAMEAVGTPLWGG